MFYREETEHVEAETLLERRSLAVKKLRLLLLSVFLLCGYKAVVGPNPWSAKIAERIATAAEKNDKVDATVLQTFEGWIKSALNTPEVFRAKEHAVIGWWWAAVIGAGISFVLFLSLPLWVPQEGMMEGDTIHDIPLPDAENAGESGFAKLVSGRPLMWGLTLLAVLAGGWLRMDRLDHSLWNDEEYAMRRFSHGGYSLDATTGKPVFEPVSWVDTMAENRNGNNHVLHSVLSRLSLGVWRSVWGHEGAEFSERWLRMPSYLAGLGAILLLGLLGWEFGLTWAGIAAAWFLALNPWHVRYAVEARGYSLMIFFLVVCLLGLLRAHRNNSLNAWLMFAVGQAGMLASFAGSIYIALALNAVAGLEMLLRRQPRRFGSLVAFGLLAAIPVLALTLPIVPQLLAFTANDNTVRLSGDVPMMRDIGSHLVAGVLYNNPLNGDHAGTSWEKLRMSLPMVYGPLGWFVGLLVILGIGTAFFDSGGTRFAIIAVAAAGALAFWHTSEKGNPNFSWYYIYLLVPGCLAMGLALVRFQFMPGLMVMLAVGLYGYATETPREIIRTVNRQPIKQTVQAIREFRPHALTGTFGVSDRQAESYDPSVEILTTVAQLEDMLAKAQQGRTAAFVYFAGDRESGVRNPELHQRVTASDDFELWREFKGTEAMFSYRIYRCVGLGL